MVWKAARGQMPMFPKSIEPGAFNDEGFTLIEVMVALGVMALLSALVMLSAPGPERRMQASVERFVSAVRHAADDAIITNQALRLSVNDAGYRFERRTRSGWLALADGDPLGFRGWPAQTTVDVRSAADAGAGRFAFFDPVGAVTPAALELIHAGRRWRLQLGPTGTVGVDESPL